MIYLVKVWLTRIRIRILKKICFDLNKMRGECYDGAAAMRGRFRGVQLLNILYIPKSIIRTLCITHSLNLC